MFASRKKQIYAVFFIIWQGVLTGMFKWNDTEHPSVEYAGNIYGIGACVFLATLPKVEGKSAEVSIKMNAEIYAAWVFGQRFSEGLHPCLLKKLKNSILNRSKVRETMMAMLLRKE